MRIKDWLISRQRYWGSPIPIIYCETCGVVGVPENELPVILPEWRDEGNPLLSEEFKRCVCPNCKQPAQR
jgi:leucyl-tRNA synthetase